MVLVMESMLHYSIFATSLSQGVFFLAWNMVSSKNQLVSVLLTLVTLPSSLKPIVLTFLTVKLTFQTQILMKLSKIHCCLLVKNVTAWPDFSLVRLEQYAQGQLSDRFSDPKMLKFEVSILSNVVHFSKLAMTGGSESTVLPLNYYPGPFTWH